MISSLVLVPKFNLQLVGTDPAVLKSENAACAFDRYKPGAQFEADHGSLEAALSVQQRRREALGERPADALRLPLLKYRHMGIWPTGNTAQRQRFEEVLGERPALAQSAGGAQPGDPPAHQAVFMTADRFYTCCTLLASVPTRHSTNCTRKCHPRLLA